MRLFTCGYCRRTLQGDKWLPKELLLNSGEIIYVVCPICLLKRGEVDFFRKEAMNVHNNPRAVPDDKEVPDM